MEHLARRTTCCRTEWNSYTFWIATNKHTCKETCSKPTGPSSSYPQKPESLSASGTGRYSHTRVDKPATTSQNHRIFGAILQLVHRLKMDERLEVHNFISAIYNKMHKVDLIQRLKKNEPHNAAHFQEQLNQQLTRHSDVIHQLMDIMKTDDYFRWTEDLPQIYPLMAHEEITKFPELFDIHETVSRVATEVDILERHMWWPIPTISGIALRRSDLSFKPIHPAAPSTEYGRQLTGDRFVSRQFHTMCTKVTRTPNITNIKRYVH